MAKGVTSWLVVGGSLIALAACDARQWPLTSRTAPAAGAPGTASPPSGAAKAAARSSARATAAPVPPAPANAAAPASAAAGIPRTFDGKADLDLVGLDAAQARHLLGAPNEEEQKPPAQVWRYRYPQCTLDVSFYPDVRTRVFRVLSYEVNGHDGTEQGKRDCSARLRARTSRAGSQ